MVWPTALTWLYFVALADEPTALQQGVYAVGKTLQFALPAAWLLLACHRPRFDGRWTAGTSAGAALGAVILAVMLLGYFGWFNQYDSMRAAGPRLAVRLSRFGMGSPAAFIAAGAFYSAIHSLLEEYYWRWFVFGRLREHVSDATAVALSSLAFMAHHIVLLATFFGWCTPATWLFSLAVAVGGAMWAALYARSGSLVGPWLSHAMADAGIFIVGYDLLRGAGV